MVMTVTIILFLNSNDPYRAAITILICAYTYTSNSNSNIKNAVDKNGESAYKSLFQSFVPISKPSFLPRFPSICFQMKERSRFLKSFSAEKETLN